MMQAEHDKRKRAAIIGAMRFDPGVGAKGDQRANLRGVFEHGHHLGAPSVMPALMALMALRGMTH